MICSHKKLLRYLIWYGFDRILADVLLNLLTPSINLGVDNLYSYKHRAQGSTNKYHDCHFKLKFAHVKKKLINLLI